MLLCHLQGEFKVAILLLFLNIFSSLICKKNLRFVRFGRGTVIGCVCIAVCVWICDLSPYLCCCSVLVVTTPPHPKKNPNASCFGGILFTCIQTNINWMYLRVSYSAFKTTAMMWLIYVFGFCRRLFVDSWMLTCGCHVKWCWFVRTWNF